MPLSRLLKHTIRVTRLTATAGMVKQHETILEGIKALVMPSDPESTTEYGIAIGQGFKIYTENSVHLRVSDKIIDNRRRVFQVRGISEYDDFDNLNHHKYMCERIGIETEPVVDEES